MEKNPKVSIGLAVYNGEEYLDEAITSILAQTFTDFELIISDNASTDRTAEICQKYVETDKRIRYSRNSDNIGGANNENLTFHLSRGQYFRWAAHDDVLAPELLEKCVSILDNHPEVILCHTGVISIDQHGNRLDVYARNNGKDKTSYKRFRAIAGSKDFMEETYGLIRSEVLKKTRLQLNYTASDRTLLCELSLYGEFFLIEEPLFYKRFHPKNTYIDWRTRMVWFDKAYRGKIVFPFWQQFFDYFVTIHRVEMSLYEKMQCYRYILGPWFLSHFKNLIKDLMVAIWMLMHSSRWRENLYRRTENWM